MLVNLSARTALATDFGCSGVLLILSSRKSLHTTYCSSREKSSMSPKFLDQMKFLR